MIRSSSVGLKPGFKPSLVPVMTWATCHSLGLSVLIWEMGDLRPQVTQSSRPESSECESFHQGRPTGMGTSPANQGCFGN